MDEEQLREKKKVGWSKKKYVLERHMEEKIRKREQRKWGDKVHRQNSQLQKAEMWKDLTEETIYPIQFLCKSISATITNERKWKERKNLNTELST